MPSSVNADDRIQKVSILVEHFGDIVCGADKRDCRHQAAFACSAAQSTQFHMCAAFLCSRV